MADEMGVKVVFGTDLVGPEQQFQLEEFNISGEFLPNINVIRSATTTVADLIGYKDKLGVVKPGAIADLIVIDGDPLKDISVLTKPEEKLKFIMKSGEIYKDETAHKS